MSDGIKDPGEISDGYHTFNELYRHRAALLIALMRSHPELSWFSEKHHDGSRYEGFFIAGMDLPTGQISYHMKLDPWWDLLNDSEFMPRMYAPVWDGHTPDDVIDRLTRWANTL